MKQFIFVLLASWLIGAGCNSMQSQGIVDNQTFVKQVNKVMAEPGDTPLIRASRAGDQVLVRSLLTNGADINATNEQGNSALIVAAQQGHTDVINALATYKKLDTEIMNWNSDTALMAAVQNKHVSAVKALLACGANPNFVKVGMTVLIAASYGGNVEIVKALLKAGADPTPVDENGESALDVAINTNKPAVVAVLREYQNKK